MKADSKAATPDTDERASIELCMLLEREELAREARARSCGGFGFALPCLPSHPAPTPLRQGELEDANAQDDGGGGDDDAESIALAMRLQQECDDEAFRNALGLGGDVSVDDANYEDLQQLNEAVPVVSRGASSEAIHSLCTSSVRDTRASGTSNIGDKCSICQMEFEEDDELRVLPCGHAEHKECLEQWLAVNKSCPLCSHEVRLVQ